ncbi:MAG: putative ABC exporter domain-containing protein [Caldicoprobacterales bacterium]
MSALVYILKKSLKNNLKGLLKKPAALITYIILACLFIMPSLFGKSSQQSSTLAISRDVMRSIFMGYTMLLFVVSIISSLSGASFFRMADVNLLFTAPIKAGYILIYGFVKQLATNFIIMLFLGLQYPNWKRIFGFADGAGWVLIIAYMLLVIVMSLVGMILYAYASKKPEREYWVKRIIYGLVIAFILPILVKTIETQNILKSIVAWLSNDYLKYIPIIGWFREMLMGIYTGINTEILVYIALNLIIATAAFIKIYRMDTEFYEKVIAGTELRELTYEAAKKGRAINTNTRVKYRKVKAKFTLEGSLAIFEKQILEKRKKGFWLLPTRTIILTLGAVIAAVSTPFDSMELMLGILGVAAYLMLILDMVAVWERDISRHYIYLIPATPFKKMLASTLVEVINITIEGILIFGIVGMILKVALPVVLSSILAYATLGIVFIYSDIVVRRMYGKIHGGILREFFRVFVLILIILFVVTPAAILANVTGNYALGISVSAAVNMVLILLFMWIGTGLFKSPELP